LKKLTFFSLAVLLLGICAVSYGANSATQTVTFEVQGIDEISVSGNPGALIINAATAGSDPDPATDNSTSYNVTTNGANKKITGYLDAVMPANTALNLTLTAPTGGTSTGQITLTTAAQDLVTGISQLGESGLTIAYEFTATAAAGVIASSTRTVTFTVTDGP
jgi:hypothetical protein